MFVVVYATTTGNTHYVAELIAKKLEARLVELSSLDQEIINSHNPLVLCASTWGQGELQDDWACELARLRLLDFSESICAICVLGDQKNYPECFASGGKKLYDFVGETHARLIGFTNKEHYNFQKSEAYLSGKFVGLILDEDNQHGLTEGRINAWCAKIKIEYERISKKPGGNS